MLKDRSDEETERKIFYTQVLFTRCVCGPLDRLGSVSKMLSWTLSLYHRFHVTTRLLFESSALNIRNALSGREWRQTNRVWSWGEQEGAGLQLYTVKLKLLTSSWWKQRYCVIPTVFMLADKPQRSTEHHSVSDKHFKMINSRKETLLSAASTSSVH